MTLTRRLLRQAARWYFDLHRLDDAAIVDGVRQLAGCSGDKLTKGSLATMRFQAFLTGEGIRRGVLGPQDVPRVRKRK